MIIRRQDGRGFIQHAVDELGVWGGGHGMRHHLAVEAVHDGA